MIAWGRHQRFNLAKRADFDKPFTLIPRDFICNYSRPVVDGESWRPVSASTHAGEDADLICKLLNDDNDIN